MHRFLAIGFLLTISIARSYSAEPSEPFEGPPLLLAKDLIPAKDLAGTSHRVGPVVEVVNFGYEYSLISDFGVFEVWGSENLAEARREVEAIAILKEIGRSEAFGRSFAAALKDPVVKAWNVARKPISTVAGIPSGALRYLQGKFYAVARGSDKAMARVRRIGSDEGDESKEPDEQLGKRVSNTTQRLSRRHLGFDKAKRAWAKRLGVNPYSENDALQFELERIAWASAIGSFAGDFAIPGSDALSYAGKAQQMVWDKSPIELEKHNFDTLIELGFSKDRALEFIEYDNLSLTEKIEIVLILSNMRTVMGFARMLDLAMGVSDGNEATVVIGAMKLLANWQSENGSIAEVAIRGGMLVGVGSNGRLLLPLNFDFLHWSPEILDTLSAEALRAESRELIVAGSVSPVSRYRLEKRGWDVRELSPRG